MADCYLQGLCCLSSTFFPGCFYFKDFCVGKNWMTAGQPKTKGAWKSQNGQNVFIKCHWGTYKKGLCTRQQLLVQKIYIVTETSKSLCDFFSWPQCVERGFVDDEIWSSFLFPSSWVPPSLGTPFILSSGSWLNSLSVLHKLEMVAKCIWQKPQLLSVELLKHSSVLV